jgi:hypothetical protein
MLQDIINNKKDQFKFWSLLYLIPILTFMKALLLKINIPTPVEMAISATLKWH